MTIVVLNSANPPTISNVSTPTPSNTATFVCSAFSPLEQRNEGEFQGMGDIYKCILTNQNFPVPVAAPLPAVAPPALPPPPLIILPPLPVNVVPPPAFVPQFPVPVAAPLPAVAPPALPPPFILPPPPLIILPPLPVHVVPPPAFVPQQPRSKVWRRPDLSKSVRGVAAAVRQQQRQ